MASRLTALEPISSDEREEWDQLIVETKKVVNRNDKAQWELVILAGKVESKYGENRIKKWADEAGVSESTARTYAWLSRKGVDEKFVTRWARTDLRPGGLSYSVIREIAGFAGSVNSKYALEYLEWATEHSATGVMVKAYMLETTAPMGGREEIAADIKMALRTKQDKEGFNDYIRLKLEEIVTEHPETEALVLDTVVSNVEAIESLKIKAGIVSDDEQKLVDKARHLTRKLRDMRKWLMTNEDEIRQSVEYGHEASDELFSYAQMLNQAAVALTEEIVITEASIEDFGEVIDFPLVN